MQLIIFRHSLTNCLCHSNIILTVKKYPNIILIAHFRIIGYDINDLELCT